MNKLLQNVNLAGTSLFLQILGVSHTQAAVQFFSGRSTSELAGHMCISRLCALPAKLCSAYPDCVTAWGELPTPDTQRATAAAQCLHGCFWFGVSKLCIPAIMFTASLLVFAGPWCLPAAPTYALLMPC
jgi:hypothetical protein